MFSIGRLLLRLIVVPIALGFAVCAATLVAFVANWNRLLATVGADTPDGGLLVVGFALLAVVSVATVWLLMPALIGALIAEAFSIRSWVFHALNGAVSMAVGRLAAVDVEWPFEVYEGLPVVLAAGLGAGFAYWAIAGWNAGFLKPVPARATPSSAAAAGPP